MMTSHRDRVKRVRIACTRTATLIIPTEADPRAHRALQVEARILRETLDAAAAVLADGLTRAVAERDRIYEAAAASSSKRPASRAHQWNRERAVAPRRPKGIQ